MLSKITVDRETHLHICHECNEIFESEGLLPSNIDCAWCMKSTNTKDSLLRYAMKYVKEKDPSCIFCGVIVDRGYFLSHITFCSYIELHFETTVDETERSGESVLRNQKTEKLKEKVNIDFEENVDLIKDLLTSLSPVEKSLDLIEKFCCEKCDFVCLSKDWLDVHKGITHDTDILFEDNKLKPKELLQSRECNICQKFFRSKKRLSRHTETIHNKEKENEPGNRSEDDSFSIRVRNYGCTKCDKKFKYYNSSIRHEKNCGKLPECNLICDHCGKGFDTEYGMKRHVRNHVENEPKLDCNECGKIFLTRDSLKIHKVYEHDGKKEELCDECGKCFLTSKK